MKYSRMKVSSQLINGVYANLTFALCLPNIKVILRPTKILSVLSSIR